MRAPLFYPSLSFLIGVLLSLYLEPTALIGFLGLLVLIVFVELVLKRSSLARWLMMVLIFGFCWGLLHGDSEEKRTVNQAIRIEGVVRGEVKRTGLNQSFDFVETGKGSDQNQTRGSSMVFFVTTTDRREFQGGDRLEIRGRRMQFQQPRNPGEWNECAWQRLRGVSGKIVAEEIRMLETEKGFLWRNWFLLLRNKAKEYLKQGDFGGINEQSLIEGMVLGDTEGMSRELKEEFRITGTGHVFAVSGQNLGIILALFILGISFVKLNRWRWGWIGLIPLFVYAGVSGFQSSCVRAWMMVGFVVVAWRIDRPTAWLNFWAATLILILLWNPFMVQEIGFQLSFLVVFGLIQISPWVMEKFSFYWTWEKFLSRSYCSPFQLLIHRWRKEFLMIGVSSFVAFLMVLPHSIFVFHQFNPGSMVLNLLVVPIAGLIVMGGSLSLLVGGIHGSLSAAINFFLVYFAKVILFLVHTTSLMTWMQFPVCDYREWRWSRDPQIVVFDLGEVPQGMIRYRGQIWLINTGNKNNYERKLRAVLKYYGISKIDAILATTVSESSNGALASLQSDYRVDRMIRPQGKSRSPLEKKWDQLQKSHPFELWTGDALIIGDADFVVRGLEETGPSELNATEDQGIVLNLEFRGKGVIWANRISERRESELIETKAENIAVLVQGRNPRENNLSENWLRTLSPEYLILAQSGRGIQKTGYDSAWNLKKRTDAEVIPLEKTGTVILDWGERIKIRLWKES